MLTTYSSFAQTYGYFEMRADMPDDQGAWPAFWLPPGDGTWPPELDVVEMHGQDPNTVIATVHSNETGLRPASQAQPGSPIQVAFTNMVCFGRKRRSSGTSRCRDRTRRHPLGHARPDVHACQSCNWRDGGPADDGLMDGAEMKVDYVKAYSLDADWHI